ncbi:hypothetical protein WUBG_06827 [Wuchereria bancrofti]|uniref:Uncharacterized protein n=1 Tax=Wuchereria bancrofti TaxID=6293 RepID=J9F4J9_WUCBA|nr:hypothetical protein WUBG_06827 [Wuchereria bancrofti]
MARGTRDKEKGRKVAFTILSPSSQPDPIFALILQFQNKQQRSNCPLSFSLKLNIQQEAESKLIMDMILMQIRINYEHEFMSEPGANYEHGCGSKPTAIINLSRLTVNVNSDRS